MQTRSISDGDLDALSDLYMRSFNAPPWNDSWTYESAKKRTSELLSHPRFVGFIALEGSAASALAMGYLDSWTHGDQFRLVEMCVDPNRQRTGIGHQLLERLASALVHEGVSQICLEMRTDGPAENFFAQCDFTPLKLTSMIRRL